MAIKLGDRVKDIYTGFEGIAAARTSWLHGCDRITIEPTELDKDGMPGKCQVFDEQRIELVEAEAPRVAKASTTTKTGGPRPDQPRGRG